MIRYEDVDLYAFYLKDNIWFNEKGFNTIKLVRKLVKLYLREKEDFSGLLKSNEKEEVLPPLPAPVAPLYNEEDDKEHIFNTVMIESEFKKFFNGP